MIEVYFGQRPKTGGVLLTVMGHAETAPKGQDLLCAAVSILVHSLKDTMEWLEKEKLGTVHILNIEEGLACLHFEPDEAHVEAYHASLLPIRLGFKRLCELYPEHIMVLYGEIREEDEKE